MISDRNKSKLNLIVSIAYQIIVVGLGVLIPRITISGYGSEVNGLLSSVLQIVGYLILLESGIQIVATQALYKTVGSNDKKATNEILAAVNKSYKKIGLFYLIGLIVLSTIFPFIVGTEVASYFEIFLIVFFSGLSNVILFFFQGKYKILLSVEGKNYFLNTLSILSTILNHGIKLLLLFLGVNIVFVVVSSFVASMIPAIIVGVFIKKRYKWINLSEKPNTAALAQNKDAIVHNVAWLIFSNIDILLLTIFCDLKVVSIYTVYKLVNDNIMNLSRMPFESITFKLGQIYNTNKERYKSLINGIEIISSTVSFVLLTVTYCLILPFMNLYTSGVNDINYHDVYLAILFVVMQLMTAMRIPMLNTINFAGHFKQTIKQVIIETAINLIVSIVGVILFGIYGVFIGTIVALLYRNIDVIIYSNKKLLDRSPAKTFLIYGVEWALFISASFIFKLVNIQINSWGMFVVAGFVTTLLVAIYYMVFIVLFFRKDLKNTKELLLRKKEQGTT